MRLIIVVDAYIIVFIIGLIVMVAEILSWIFHPSVQDPDPDPKQPIEKDPSLIENERGFLFFVIKFYYEGTD